MTTLLTASGRLNGPTFAALAGLLAIAAWLVRRLTVTHYDIRVGHCPQCGQTLVTSPGLWEQCIAVHNEEFCGRGR